MMPWYALAVHSGTEAKISIKLGAACWYPQRVVWAKRRHRRKGEGKQRKLYPLISGYLFVMQEHSASVRDLISDDKNVFGFVSVDGKPLGVSDREIAFLRQQESDGVYDETALQHLAVMIGQEYLIMQGLFAGCTAKVKSIENKQFVVDIQGISQRVKIPVANFEKIRQAS